jgi:hypothetical protein
MDVCPAIGFSALVEIEFFSEGLRRKILTSGGAVDFPSGDPVCCGVRASRGEEAGGVCSKVDGS